MIFLINLLIIFVALFPKINIISVGTSSAGIRVEDFLLALICALLFVFSKYNRKNKAVDEDFLQLKKYFIYILLCLLFLLFMA